MFSYLSISVANIRVSRIVMSILVAKAETEGLRVAIVANGSRGDVQPMVFYVCVLVRSYVCVCMYVYVCVCIYTYIYIYMYIRIHI